QTARLDRPGLRVVGAEVDRRHTDDLPVLDIDEDRSAVGHVAVAHGAVGKPRADPQADALAHHDGLRKPIAQIFRSLDCELEIFLRVDLVEPVDRRHEQGGAERCSLEGERDVRIRSQPSAGAYPAVADRVPAADLLIARLALRAELALIKPRSEWG